MECLKTKKVRDKKGFVHVVPCGECAFCLTNKRSGWMFRIYHEMRTQMHKGWFLTLTYDEKHVKRLPDGRLSLRFRDVQLYLKRLRKAKHYVKYVCVGEYGGETHRPHYHMLLWTSATPEELQAEWKSSKDNTPFGSIHFGKLSMQSAMYTLKYIIQPKQKAVDGIEKTRAQFSKGLGLSFLTTAMYEYLTEDYENPVLFVTIDGAKVAIPRYYKGKIFTKYQMRVQNNVVKLRRKKRDRVESRELIAQGVVRTKDDAAAYLAAIRSEQAKRIIAKTKYSQSL